MSAIMSDPSAQQPTQEEIEAYYAQMREAPIGEILMQCIGLLAGAAEAKLGRSDARTAIDAMAAVVQIGEGHLGEVSAQLKDAVGQLQMAQVQVEKQIAAEQGGAPAEDASNEQAPSTQPSADQPQQPSAPQAPQQQAPQQAPQTSKLWTPGR